MRTRTFILAAAGSVALAGCAYGYGGYGDYGYGGVSLGLGYGGGYPGYYDYGGWYGDPYFGWYDGFYYPGSGYYVYDSYRRPHRWDHRQEHHWTQRRDTVMSTSRTRGRAEPTFQQNWSGFNRHSGGRTHRP